MKILTSEQMQWVDRVTVERYGLPGLLLMETAGSSAARIIEEHYNGLENCHVKVFCAKGNNGGDGAVIARHLWLRGCVVDLYLLGRIEETRGDAKVNFEIVRALSETESPNINYQQIETLDELCLALAEPCDLYIDALFGTGAARPLEGIYRELVEIWNESTTPVVSVDIPSGLSANDSEPTSTAVQADLTVTMSAPKIANLLPPASHLNGRLVVVPIGSPDRLLEESGSKLNLVEREEIELFLALSRRSPGAYKNAVGHVLVVAGGRGKAGAAGLTASAVLRAGAGLVTLFTPASCAESLVVAGLELMTEPVEECEPGVFSLKSLKQILEATDKKSVLACGPGIGTHSETRELVKGLLRECKLPLVLDADALNCLLLWPEALQGSESRPVVITPHPGEMNRLLGGGLAPNLSARIEQVSQYASAHNVIVVLKGERTVIASPDGQVYLNPTGNAGMATAGAGDVLTGIMAAMIAQSQSGILDAVIASVYLHGLAGDLAAEELGQRSMTASDITRKLPAALLEVGGEREKHNH